MIRKIKLSKRASIKLEKLLNYLENEWSEKVMREFVMRFDKCLSIISNNPESFEKSDFIKGLHKCSSQNKLPYIINLILKTFTSLPFLITDKIQENLKEKLNKPRFTIWSKHNANVLCFADFHPPRTNAASKMIRLNSGG